MLPSLHHASLALSIPALRLFRGAKGASRARIQPLPVVRLTYCWRHAAEQSPDHSAGQSAGLATLSSDGPPLTWLCGMQDAIDSLGHSDTPKLIYIKSGVYYEKVKVHTFLVSASPRDWDRSKNAMPPRRHCLPAQEI